MTHRQIKEGQQTMLAGWYSVVLLCLLNNPINETNKSHRNMWLLPKFPYHLSWCLDHIVKRVEQIWCKELLTPQQKKWYPWRWSVYSWTRRVLNWIENVFYVILTLYYLSNDNSLIFEMASSMVIAFSRHDCSFCSIG